MRNSHLLPPFFALALLVATSHAQTSPTPAAPTIPVAPDSTQTTTTKTESQVVEVRTLAPDLLIMSAGSVLVVRGKQKSRLETELRLSDGSILTPGGTVRRADGSATMLADNQAISPAGKISAAPPGTQTETTGTGLEIVPVEKP